MKNQIINVTHNGDNETCIIEECIPSYFFTDNNGEQPNSDKINKYKTHFGYDFVILHNNKFIFCNSIEDATILEEEEE